MDRHACHETCTFRWPRRALWVCSFAWLACGPGRDSDAQASLQDAGHPSGQSEQSEASTRGPQDALPPCMWTPPACSPHIDWRFATLLRARELGQDARFTSIGGQVVGATLGSPGSHCVVRLLMADERARSAGQRFRRYTLPESIDRLIDVVDGVERRGDPPAVYALACARDSACSLWRVSSDLPDNSALEEVTGSTFDGDATALVFDEFQQQPCVLAHGMHCFDGAWHEDIAPDADDEAIREVAMGHWTSIAVSFHGIYWTRPGVPSGGPAMPWTRRSAGADVTWTGASDIYAGYFLIGEDGAFMQSSDEATSLCSHTSDFAASSGSVLVTEQGEVLFGLNDGRCSLQSLDDAPIIGSSTAYCRASQNPLLLTAQSVLGTTYCAEL